MCMNNTHRNVRLSNKVIEELKKIKHPGQTYDGVITELIELAKKHNK